MTLLVTAAWFAVGFIAPWQGAPERPAVFSHPIAIAAAPPAFLAVNRALRAAEPLQADFTETKKITALKRPLTSSGRLVFAAKLGLYRATTAPRAQELLITSKGVAQRDGAGKVERFDVAKQPIVKSFVDAFLLVLSGDEKALAAQFDLFFDGSAEQWSLGFVPRNEPLTKVIATIVVEGRGEWIDRVTITEKSGDTTTTAWSNVVTHKALTADEEKRDFGWLE